MASPDEAPPRRGQRLLERFPALRRLERGGSGGKIPYVQQHTAADCGSACLAMVLGYHGRRVRLDTVRDSVGAGRDGASALDLVQAARRYNLRGRGVTLEVADLDYLPPASILHWGFDHFVVYEGQDKKHIKLVDPALGPRRVSFEEFGRYFTGVALIFDPLETFATGQEAARPVWGYVRRVLSRSGLLGRILLLTAMAQLVGLGLPILTGALVDRVIPRSDIGLMQILAVGFAGLLVFNFLLSYLRAFLMLHLRTELDARMTLDFLEHMFDLPYPFFQTRSAGDLIMRLNSNAVVRELITSSALSGALDSIMLLSYLVLLMLISPLLGGLVLLLGFLRVVVFLFSRHKIRDLMTENLAKEARSQGYEVQMFTGIETLKAAGAEPRALEHWSHLFVDVLNVSINRGRLDALVQSVIGSLSFVSPLVIMLTGGWLVIQGHLSLGTMLALNALAQGFLTPLSSLVGTAMSFQQLGSYVDRLDDVLSTPKEQDPEKVVNAPRLQGGIRCENVTFQYAINSAPAVEEISLDITPGQMVAIVGRSAAGKTTLANLMLGLYQPTKGRVLYDGIDLTGLDARSVRSQLGVVTQHTHLFGGSIRENIALADPELTRDDIEVAAKLAHIHDEIMAMPLGYNTILSEGGLSLSGGQRQRIALARALSHDPAILFLDEATSSLDAQIEAQIQAALAGLGCTRIVVAHRLSTVRDANVILVLEKGRLVEQGTHAELMRANGLYAELVMAQSSEKNTSAT